MLTLVRWPAALLDAALEFLVVRRSAAAIGCALLPMLAILLFPSGFGENESQYLMLAYRQVKPEAFSPYSAAFDNTHARLLTQLLMGGLVEWLGYATAQVVLRVLMMVLYAAAIGGLFAALGLSVLESVLVFAVYGLVGPDLMGAEWLFRGIESKTFAYAAVFLAFGLYWRGRPWPALAAMTLATYLHFLVGGFWCAALLLLMALRAESLRAIGKPLVVYATAVLPVLAVLVHDQYIANAAVAVPAHGMTADYLYAIIRVPHHTAPFADLYGLGFWMQGILATAGLLCAFLLLGGRVTDATLRPTCLWLALLLAYLLLAVAISAFDATSGAFGKFLPFRPSALILFFCVTALLLVYRGLADGTPAGLRGTLLKAAFVAVVPVFLWASAKDHIKTLALGAGHRDLPEVMSFLRANAGPGDIVLTDPEVDMKPLGADLPRLIAQPTLVSFKFVPLNPADLYRWWDLLQFRKAVYAGACPTAADPPVRFVLYVDRPADQAPGCGRVAFRSHHFMLAELDKRGG